MCCAPNVYMFVYTLIGAHIVPLNGLKHVDIAIVEPCFCRLRGHS